MIAPKLNPDGKHNRRCPCEPCVTKREERAARQLLPKDGSVCIGTTRCLCPQCRDKRLAYNKQYGQVNREALRKKAVVRNEGRKEEIAAYQKEYRAAHKEELSEWGKRHREENKDRINAQRAQYREENRDLINERQKDYYQANREDRLAYAKEFREEKMHPDYKIWDGIKQRCYNPENGSYKYYGERGITMCDRWLESFDNFITDMGERPEPRSSYSIDRRDFNGNYEPGNCRWATAQIQAINKRNSVYRRTTISDDSPVWIADSTTIPITEFSERYDIPLIICKYRYAENPTPDWIINGEGDVRYYTYRGRKYTMVELTLLSGLGYHELADKIINQGMNVEEAMSS